MPDNHDLPFTRKDVDGRLNGATVMLFHKSNPRQEGQILANLTAAQCQELMAAGA
jgi:hypothetical protein